MKVKFILFYYQIIWFTVVFSKISVFLLTLEPPVTIVGNSNDPEYQEMMAGDDLILACEVSRASAPVQWYCNGRQLTSDPRTYIESYGTLRKIIISNIQSSDSGLYVCDAVDDKMVCNVRIQGKLSLGRLKRDYSCNKTEKLTTRFAFLEKSLRSHL